MSPTRSAQSLPNITVFLFGLAYLRRYKQILSVPSDSNMAPAHFGQCSETLSGRVMVCR